MATQWTLERVARHVVFDGGASIDGSSERLARRAIGNVHDLVRRGYSLEEAVALVPGTRMVKKPKKRAWIPVMSLCVALVACIGGAAGYMYAGSKMPHEVVAVSQPGDTWEAEPAKGTTILVVGTDERPVDDRGYGTKTDVPGIRTDVIMVVNVSGDGKRISAMSIPRDSQVTRPDCTMYDYETKTQLPAPLPPAQAVKINTVYQDGGAQCVVRTVEKLTGTHIDGYVGFSFDTFAAVVDALGGVEITTDTPLIDDTLGTVIAEPGTHTLTGEDALNFVRARKIAGESKNDFERIHRQQQFVSSLIHSLATSGKLTSSSFMSSMFSGVLPTLSTDGLSVGDIASLAASIRHGARLSFHTLPVTSEFNENGFVQLDNKAVKDIFFALNNDQPLEGDPTPDGTLKIVSDSSLAGAKVLIVSKSPYDQRASQLSDALTLQGAMVSRSQTDRDEKETTIYVADRAHSASALIASMYPSMSITAELTDEPVSSDTVVIALGSQGNDSIAHPSVLKEGVTIFAPYAGAKKVSAATAMAIPHGIINPDVAQQ